MAGGLVGGFVGNMFNAALTGSFGNMAVNMMDRLGATQFGDALTNLFINTMGEGLKGMVDSMPVPDFMKDMAKDVINEVIDSEQKQGVSEAGAEMVEEAFGQEAEESAEALVEQIMENMAQAQREETQASGGGGGSVTNNWFYALAKAMGEVSGEHLQTMVNKADAMSGLTGKDQASEMAVVQAEMQAAAQQYKMSSETASTVLKSIGEGMAAVARKQ